MSQQVEAALRCACQTTGQAPHWDGGAGELLFVDVEVGTFHRWNPETGDHAHIKREGRVSLLVPTEKEGSYVVAENQKLAVLDWESEQCDVIGEVETGMNSRIDDGRCDVNGRLFAGTMSFPKKFEGNHLEMDEGLCNVYRVEPDRSITPVLDQVSMANGMAWTGDNGTMFLVDSWPRELSAFDYDVETGSLSNRRSVVKFAEDTLETHGYPHGLTVDSEDKLWVPCFMASKVIRIDPETGKELQSVTLPVSHVTGCCFGGKNLDELYVTSSSYKLTMKQREEQPLAGSVFKVTGLGVTGRPSGVYKG